MDEEQNFLANNRSKKCWVCLVSSEEDAMAAWVRPCKCKGSVKWVHQTCVKRLILEKLNGNIFLKVKCRRCGTRYIIHYPPLDFLAQLMERLDRSIVMFSTCIMGVVFFVIFPLVVVCLPACLVILPVSLYLCTVAYGATTVCIIYGNSDGQALMSACHIALLMVALPLIPLVVMEIQSINWEDALARFLIRLTTSTSSQPIGQLPATVDSVFPARIWWSRQPIGQLPCTVELVYSSRIWWSLPIFAKIVGDFLFENRVQSPLWRFLLGGTVFLGLKSAANVYFEFRQMQRRQRCTVVDFVESRRRAAAVVAVADNDGEEQSRINNFRR